MNRGKNVVQWIFAGIFLTAALGTDFGIGTLFCILAAVLMAPIKFLRNKIKLPRAIIIILSVVLCFSGVLLSPTESTEKQGVLGQQQISKEDKEDKEDKEKGEIQEGDKEAEDNEREPIGSEQSAVNDSSLVETYAGVAYTVINDNIPSFSSEELTTTGYEKYSDLDSLGRCGVAIASCGREIMPKAGEDRGSISSVKPSGWVQAKYEGVSGGYLYNRCHLIGWQLSAENANKKNLITGTRYMNTEGMLVFENMVADYIKETGNHVAYRITPIYEGNNLVASGVQMEAYSIEDDGEGICFNVYCYNVQPGIQIDYATGKSQKASGGSTTSNTASSSGTTSSSTTSSSASNSSSSPSTGNTTTSSEDIVYRTPSGKRYHLISTCGGKNSYAINRSQIGSLTPCNNCAKEEIK